MTKVVLSLRDRFQEDGFKLQLQSERKYRKSTRSYWSMDKQQGTDTLCGSDEMRQEKQQFGNQRINLKGLMEGSRMDRVPHTLPWESGTADWLGGCEAVWNMPQVINAL